MKQISKHFIQQINVKKWPSGILCQDSNPRPSYGKSHSITTRTGLPGCLLSTLDNCSLNRKFIQDQLLLLTTYKSRKCVLWATSLASHPGHTAAGTRLVLVPLPPPHVFVEDLERVAKCSGVDVDVDVDDDGVTCGVVVPQPTHACSCIIFKGLFLQFRLVLL